MIWIDYAILGIVGISGVISLMRGFIREALSLAGWIAAFWAALAFSGVVAMWLEGYVSVPSVRVGIAFAGIFFGVLLLGGIVLRLAGLVVEKTGMSGTDRTLGIVFGVLRGIMITALLVLLAGLTALPRDPWWSQSVLLPHLVELAREIHAFLPPDMQEAIHFDTDP
ncbi:MAG: CvpA family protein [Thiotrichales bacterium]|nr:CvpA family protein [Thiotrichales bacterium]MCY4351402.1 CvpA family protein [Thiotrichales bacterium]